MTSDRLRQTRRLATAFRRVERAEAALRDAKREFDDVYQPWSAGTSVERGEVRKMLVLAGYLE